MSDATPSAGRTSAERLKAFTDGVVAIAMTLLVLPLVESVTDLGGEGRGVADFFVEEYGQIVSFALSFVLIANAWFTNHRVLARVEYVSPALMSLSVLWMFTIVWLPVPTAMLGSMPTDTLQKVVYIGSLIATAVVMVVIRVHLSRHRELHRFAPGELRSGILADSIVIALYLTALAVAIAVPAIGYWAMCVLFLVSPLHRLVTSAFDRRDAGRAA
ncbi:DUF1211 domain-containing protein [Agromyces sp. CFH 90414]|uniref:DUF1211 domain-containing protein n=1 Tax=Agromyces agglutinans TaxID=2662258 RepID=A0A6I2FDG3_9MICO|nr:TMEM175 family protein [Agromyces agglutinans]MRG59128.1 DUF1211 domain-containing protein [Agromyces agglutinans]